MDFGSFRLTRIPPVDVKVALDKPFVEFVGKLKSALPDGELITFGQRGKQLAAWVSVKATDGRDDGKERLGEHRALHRLTAEGSLKEPLTFDLRHLSAILSANQDITTLITTLKLSSEGLAWLEFVAGDLVARYYLIKQDVNRPIQKRKTP